MRYLYLIIVLLSLSDISLGQAVWRGRSYSAPVCNSPNCQMCNAIREQLYTPPTPQPTQTYVPPAILSPPEIPLFLSEVRSVPKLDKVDKLVPTPTDALKDAIQLLALKPSDIFVEPGCGNGTLLAMTSKVCISIGIEINQDSAKLARQSAIDAIIIQGDAAIYNYDKATAVYMYLYPDLMEKIIPILKPGTRVVSYLHKCNGMSWSENTVNGNKFYVGIK